MSASSLKSEDLAIKVEASTLKISALLSPFSSFLLKVTKQRDPDSHQHSLFFQIDYPEIVEGVQPRHRFMSAYEQRVEPPDRQWQYLLFAAEPYETIAFKVQLIETTATLGLEWLKD